MKKISIIIQFSIITIGLFAQNDFSPAISPNGEKVAFYRYIDKVPQLYIMDIDGTNLQKITKFNHLWSIGPIWSSDMSKIYFSHGENMASMDVSTLNLETKKIIRIKKEGMQFALGECEDEFIWASKENGLKFYASSNSKLEEKKIIDAGVFKKYWVYVSPSGTFITVNDEGNEGVYLKDSDALKQLIKMKNIQNLSVSKDGTKMIFEAKVNEIPDIFMADIDGRNLKNLTRSQSTDYMPSISPKADFILFSSNRSGSFCIYKMDLKNNQLSQLTGLVVEKE